MGITIDQNNNLYVADMYSRTIKKVTPDGTVSVIAGNGDNALVNGNGTNASFKLPEGILYLNGEIFIAENDSHVIRKIDSNGNVSTFSGGAGATTNGGFVDGNSSVAKFKCPSALTYGNGSFYISDYCNDRIRKIDSNGNVSSVAGSQGNGSNDGIGTAAGLNAPDGIVYLNNKIYFVGSGNNAFRSVDLSNNLVETLIGVSAYGGASYGDVLGIGNQARFGGPYGLVVSVLDPNIIFLTDKGNHKIKKINLSNLEVTSFVGSTQGDKDSN